MSILSQNSLDILFNNARSHSFWQEKDVSEDILQEIYDLAKLGPTSANCLPMRIVFVKSEVEKEKLKSCMFEGNVEKTVLAPVTALFAYDLKFYEHLPILFPFVDARPWFTSSEQDTFEHSFRNATLQAAYFIIAARAKGIDCGPMSGFDSAKVNALFFKDTSYKINFMCNLGYGITDKLHPRLPRLSFDDTCVLL